MTSLQLGLIAAGVVLVVGVIIYNWLIERKVRRRIDEAFRPPEKGVVTMRASQRSDDTSGRIEPALQPGQEIGALHQHRHVPRASVESDIDGYEAPLQVHARIASEIDSEVDDRDIPEVSPLGVEGASTFGGSPPSATGSDPTHPDPDIECIATLQPVKPVTAGALAAGLHARLGRPLRWFGRRGAALPWQLLKSDTVGEFSEIAACLLLANRAGAASAPLLDAFFKTVGDVASALPAAVSAPDASAEAARGEALDRICADLDMQIGITVLKMDAAPITGTRLRGIAEASGFNLGDSGRFDWIQEETGVTLYSLQNYRPEPFTADMLRQTSTPGAVFLLDVPRVPEPVRVFDQMRLAARRMAQTLEATLVDDNRRAIDEAALNTIREQIRTTVTAMREVNIEPGSPRALALFGG